MNVSDFWMPEMVNEENYLFVLVKSNVKSRMQEVQFEKLEN